MDTASNFMSDGTLRDNVSTDENRRLHRVPQYNSQTASETQTTAPVACNYGGVG